MQLAGIHHITGFARDGEECIRFYREVLGLRLVKVTVNHDDPSSYHIYFGDHRATPGTLLTFFLWPDAPRRPSEHGQVETIAYAIPRGSSEYWRERLTSHEVDHEPLSSSDDAIALRDPDGLAIELVEADSKRFDGLSPATGVPAEYAVGKFLGATFAESDPAEVAQLFQSTFGMEPVDTSNERVCLRLADGGEITLIKRQHAEQRTTAMSPGIIHHIAFRAADDEEQTAWRERVRALGIRATSVRDRIYFRSIYFRETGGVLFEIATDGPGMTADEPLESLGERFVLPKWLEPRREEIERSLPPLHTGAARKQGNG